MEVLPFCMHVSSSDEANLDWFGCWRGRKQADGADSDCARSSLAVQSDRRNLCVNPDSAARIPVWRFQCVMQDVQVGGRIGDGEKRNGMK